MYTNLCLPSFYFTPSCDLKNNAGNVKTSRIRTGSDARSKQTFDFPVKCRVLTSSQHGLRGQRSPEVEVNWVSYSCRTMNLRHFCNMSPRCKKTHAGTSLLRYSWPRSLRSDTTPHLSATSLTGPCCVKRYVWEMLNGRRALPLRLWNVSEADCITLICVKQGDQLVEVISVMWIKFKWEAPFAGESPEEFSRWKERRAAEHNAATITITNPFLRNRGEGKPRVQASRS